MDKREEFLQRYREKMAEIDAIGFDPEEVHTRADAMLCEILRELSLDEIADWFRGLYKWYA